MTTRQTSMATIVICAMLTSLYAVAADIRTTDGRAYTNAAISRVEPDGVSLRTSSGIQKVFFSEMDDSSRAQFNHNPNAAAEYARKQAQGQAAFHAAQQQGRQTQLGQIVAAREANPISVSYVSGSIQKRGKESPGQYEYVRDSFGHVFTELANAGAYRVAFELNNQSAVGKTVKVRFGTTHNDVFIGPGATKKADISDIQQNREIFFECDGQQIVKGVTW